METLFFFVFVAVLVLISYVDIKKLEIPDTLSLLLIFGGIFYHLFFTGRIVQSVLGAGVYSLPFALIYGYGSTLLKKEALGYGDVKLATGIGSCITYTGLGTVYIFFTMSFVLGSIYCVFLLIKRKAFFSEKDEPFPFGPFISISGGITMFLLTEYGRSTEILENLIKYLGG